MIDTQTLTLAKQYANQVVGVGIKNLTYTAPDILNFTLGNNSVVSISIPSLHTHGNLTTVLDKLSLDGSGKLLFDGQPLGGSSTTKNVINVVGTTQGMYSDGNIIPIGTDLETIVKNMLQTVILPTYTNPTLSITGNGVLNVEVGTSIIPMITPTYVANDAGSTVTYKVKKNGTSVFTNPTVAIYTDTSFIVPLGITQYQSEATYNAGAIKNDNIGNPSPTNAIPSGTIVSNIIKYEGKRNAFYGTAITNYTPSTSTDIRGLSGKTLGITNGSTFNLNVASGTKHICIAYPDTLQGITQIKSVNMNSDIKDVFTLITISVNDASGGNAKTYKVYYYNPATAFPSADILQIII